MSSTSMSFLSQFGYKLIIKRLPEIAFNLQRINLPGLMVGESPIDTPFVKIPYPSDKVNFNDLSFSFKVDQDLMSYFSIWDWMIRLGFNTDFDQYKELATRKRFPPNFEEGEVTSDIEVLLLDNKHVPKFQFNFVSCFPTMLSDLVLTSTDTTVNYLTADVTMKYTLYSYKKLV